LSTRQPPGEAEAVSAFDAYAGSYDADLHKGIRFSGESSSFFAEGRVERLGFLLAELGQRPRVVLDFGRGTGTTIPLLLGLPGVEQAIGVDNSLRLLDVCRNSIGADRATFHSGDVDLDGVADLAYCNGVFHHIAPESRAAALRYVVRALRPDGLFAFCENNPYNPGTKLVMHNIPFDRDAQTLTPRVARALLAAQGLQIIGTQFMFFFPRVLHALRALEPHLAGLPLGAQYMVLARKPSFMQGPLET